MHFSIPDTQELYSETTGATYTGYNIYINGSYHCCLRYKQLHGLHEILGRRFSDLPAFPPKRLLPLTNAQLETRRGALEHYLQSIGQDARIAKLEIFQNFLLNAQQETAAAEGSLDGFLNEDYTRSFITLEVMLMNGYQLQVNCRIGTNASTLVHKACNCLQVSLHMIQYFCLYLVRRDIKTAQFVLLRRLDDFESPYLSQLRAQPCQIVLRKSFWNPAYDLLLLKDKITLNLLFIQTVADVENDWIITAQDILQKLHSLQKHGLKKEYMEMARQLPLYGCLQFQKAIIDYPEKDTTAIISIGNRELSMRTAKGDKIYETKFRVTRMRCWRVTALHNTQDTKDVANNLQLSFEYLMSKQTLRWITISSAQAMLMSVCLQCMVDELLKSTAQKKESNEAQIENSISNKTTSTTPTSQTTKSKSNLSSSTPSFSHDISTSVTQCSPSSSTNTSPPAPVKFLTQRNASKQNSKIVTTHAFAAVFFRNSAQESVHNEAFDGIGDHDL